MGSIQLLLKQLAHKKHLLDKLSTCLKWNWISEPEYLLVIISCSTAGSREPAEMVKLSINRHQCVSLVRAEQTWVMKETFLEWKKQKDFPTSYTDIVTNTGMILKCEEFQPKCWGNKLIWEWKKACILLRPYSNTHWGQKQNPQAWATLGTQQTTLL